MGGETSKIITKDVKYEQIKASSPIEVTKFCPPFRKFKNQTRNESNTQITFNVDVEKPIREKISITQRCFVEMEEAFDAKTKNIQLDAILFDEHYLDRKVFIAKQDNKEMGLLIRPYIHFNSHNFNNILYELHMNETIKNLNCPMLNTFVDYYSIQTGLEIEGQEFPNSEIFIMEPIATNLSEIIKYRRENNWNWTISEFNVLANNLAKALQKLHENGITHNDIRPFNVYYSIQKQCYQLGAFANAVKKNPEVKSNTIRTSMFFGAPELQVESQADLQQADIYSLGMTLLCAFYLCEPVDRKAATPYNRKYEDKYKIMKVIREMIMPIDRRQSLEKIIQNIGEGSSSPKMKSLITSLRYKNSPKDRMLVQAKKALSEGYQRLGLWNQWRNNVNQAFEMEENTLDDYKKALSLSQLAKIESCRGDTGSRFFQYADANQNAKKASKIFRNLGYVAYDQGNVNEAISLFNKSIESSKYFQTQNDIDLSKNLQGLALAHSEKGDYQVAKPLISEAAYIAQKNTGKDSLDYCKIKMSEAQIESDFGEFEACERVLLQCFNIAENKAKLNEDLGLKLKAQILHDSGRNLMLQSSYDQSSQESTLNRALKSLNDSMELNQTFPNNHIAIAANIQAFGEVQMRKGNYIEARNNFRKAELMRQTYLREHNQVQGMDKEKADNLCHIAACETELKEYEQAIKTYNESLKIYRKLFGSDHNKLSAIAIGNMSKVYYKLDEKFKARQCLELATQIIEDVSGVDDPDYEHFKMLLQKV